MSVSQDQVVDYIKNLRLAEVKALIEVLGPSSVSGRPPPS